MCRHRTTWSIYLVLIAVAWGGVATTRAANEPPPETEPAHTTTKATTEQRSLTREEELHLLDARRAQLALDQAKTEMKTAEDELEEILSLFKDNMVTIDKVNEARLKYERAVLTHEQAEIDVKKKRLEFLKDATLVTVVDAKKYRNEENEVMAGVTLRNDSDINKARIAMEGGGEELSDERLASLLKVDNVIVTLKGEARIPTGTGEQAVPSGKAIVGDPFQQIVPELQYGQEIVLTYRLVKKDVENVTVCLEFLGTQKDYDVFLKKESAQDLPMISSAQYSQIGELGSKIRYGLELERLAKTEQGFSLVVLNLPEEIKASFLDPETEAMLTEVKFTEELSKQNLNFQLSIPEKLTTELVGSDITFYILVTHRKERKNIDQVRRKHEGKIPPEEIAKLTGSKLELTLIPQGVPKLEIIVPNLFKEIEQGEKFTIRFSLLNSGTLAVRRVKPKLDFDLDWGCELVPPEAEVINGGEKVLFKAHVTPPGDVEVGTYTVKMEAEGHSGVEIVDALDKDFVISVTSQSSITGTAILVGLLIVLVLGIAIASIKISRR